MNGVYILMGILLSLSLYYYYLYHHCKKSYFEMLLTEDEVPVKTGEKMQYGGMKSMDMMESYKPMTDLLTPSSCGGQAMIESYEVSNL